jgi:DNA-binding winged helix-turn-helix (wHTH) protein
MFQSGSGERPHPYVDDDGLLRFGSDWVSLSPVESQLVGVLLETPGAVVPRQMMIKAGWPHLRESETGPNRTALDAHVLRLRRRLKGIGLTVRTIRSRGYILDVISKASDEMT